MKKILLAMVAFVALIVGAQAQSRVPITASMWHEWDGFTASANVANASPAGMVVKMNTPLDGGAVFAGPENGSVPGSLYADFSEYAGIYIKGTAGTPWRGLFNRQNLGDTGEYVNVTKNLDDNGELTLYFSEIAGLGEYVHLNSSKMNWGASGCTITEFSLISKGDAPKPWEAPEGEVNILTLPWVNNGQGCTVDFGKDKGNVYGTDAGGDNLSYVDVTKCSAIKIYGESSSIRAFINRSEFSSGTYIFHATIGADGVAVIKTKDILAAQPGATYVHLNGIKAGPNWDSRTTVFGITVVPIKDLNASLAMEGNGNNQTSATFSVAGTASGNTVMYSVNGAESPVAGGKFTYTPDNSMYGRDGKATVKVTIREYNAENDIVAECEKEITFFNEDMIIYDLPVTYEYTAKNISAIFTATALNGGTLKYSLDGVEAGTVKDGTFTVKPTEADFKGKDEITIVVKVSEYDKNGKLYADYTTAVTLYNNLPELPLKVEYSNDKSAANITVYPVALGTTVRYFLGDEEIVPAGEAVNDKFTINMDDIEGTSVVLTVREYNDQNKGVSESTVTLDFSGSTKLPEMLVDFYYTYNNGSAVFTVSPTVETNRVVYSIVGETASAKVVENAKFEVVATDEQLGDKGVANLTVLIEELDDNDNVVARKTVNIQLKKQKGVPGASEPAIIITYSEDQSSATMVIKGTDKNAQIIYTLDANDEEPEYQLYEGPVTLAWMEARADEFGITIYNIGVKEVQLNDNGEIVEEISAGFEQAHLSKPIEDLPEPIINVMYDEEDNSTAKLFIQGTAEGTQILYTLDANNEEPEYQLYEGPVTLAWMEARADEFGITIYNIGVKEVILNENGEIEKTISEGFEQVHLSKPQGGKEPVAEISDLTAEMFCRYDGFGADANVTQAGVGEYNIGESSGLPYGNGNVEGSTFADLTEYALLKLTVTEGTPRLLLNRQGMDNSGDFIEINSADNQYVLSTEGGVWTIDIAAIVEEAGFAHLNCIKGANWANCTITEAKLVKMVEPLPEPIINVVYNEEDYSSAKVFIQGVGEDTQIYYTLDANEEEPEYQLYEGPVTLAWMDARADEFGITIYNFGVKEYVVDEDYAPVKLVSEGFEQIHLSKPIEVAEEEEVDLTAEMFCRYDGYGADANVTAEGVGEYHIGESSGLPYGNGNVEGSTFADLTEYTALKLTVTEGTPRLLLNRQGMDNSGDFIEINSADSPYVISVEDGVWTYDIAKIVEEAGFAHLNCIKGANWANCTITEAKLVKAAEEENGIGTKVTLAADKLDGQMFIVTDEAMENVFALGNGNTWDMGPKAWADVQDSDEEFYIVKFEKVDAGVEGNIYTLRLYNAQGNNYRAWWDESGYLNFQPGTASVIFALGCEAPQWGQDFQNGGIWNVQYEAGKGYLLENVGRPGEYLSPASANPIAEKAYVQLFTNEATAIKEVSAAPAVKAAGIYTITGAKVEALQKGINIVIDENGAAKKVYIK